MTGKYAFFKRGCLCLMTMLMLSSVLFGCGQESGIASGESTGTGTESSTTPSAGTSASPEKTSAPVSESTAARKPLLEIAGNDLRDFRIVLPENCDGAILAAAQNLVKHYEATCGRAPEIVYDNTPAEDGIHEIHIGATNRTLTTSESFYYVVTQNGNLYLGGVPEVLAPDAVSYYIQNYKDFAKNDISEIRYCEAPLSVSVPGQGEYQLVWHDEFDLDKLDSTKWAKAYLTVNPEVTYEKGKEFIYVSDGKLNFDIVSRTRLPMPVSTRESMYYQYGYIQCSMKFPSEYGGWPAFWMTSDPNNPNLNLNGSKYLAEVDVLESFGDSHRFDTTIHKWYLDTGNHDSLPIGKYELPDMALADEYHVYGFGWDAEKMWFDLDGTVLYTIEYMKEDYGAEMDGMGGFQNPISVHLNLNGVVGEKYASQFSSVYTALAEDADFPVNLSIDWIRLYQIPGQGNLYYNFK